MKIEYEIKRPIIWDQYPTTFSQIIFMIRFRRPIDGVALRLRSSENSVPIPLTTPSLTFRLRSIVKTGLSESEAEAEEPNQPQSAGTWIVIVLSFRFCFRLRQFGFH